jgi:hypothetical protein
MPVLFTCKPDYESWVICYICKNLEVYCKCDILLTFTDRSLFATKMVQIRKVHSERLIS